MQIVSRAPPSIHWLSRHLYSLVTDKGYMNEAVGWEKLYEMDGDNIFVNSDFVIPRDPKPLAEAREVSDPKAYVCLCPASASSGKLFTTKNEGPVSACTQISCNFGICTLSYFASINANSSRGNGGGSGSGSDRDSVSSTRAPGGSPACLPRPTV